MRPRVHRRPWGVLWADAPWDGTARPPEPAEETPSGLTIVGIPAAAPVPASGPPARRLLRRPWGELLAAAPWAGRAADEGEAGELVAAGAEPTEGVMP